MKTILITGIEPFDNQAVNPSWEIARQLQRRQFGDAQVATCRLPCVFGLAAERLIEAVVVHRPLLVLALGQAGGRSKVSLERVAINIDDARIPDNHGEQPIDRPIISGGPAAYFSTLPLKAMVQAMVKAGVPAEVSQTAGTFVCNHIMYGLLHFLARADWPVRGGFIHVPYLPSQAAAHPGAPSMATATVLAGLEAAIMAALNTERDIAVTGGAVS
ncbi:pyroglutamyl-peptidase I [Biostraticola tofi]|uniref:Pyrrolidone-carboxylate peptidase n=1 Tax=Biostraticola tofi TaxID=466109 RepID=A0A4R3YZD8_9GAMM|nr:pyroglutamyl-peptidase I [Biostraticola tofi]TCV98006.1 pyroglutamyl-peptidase [Biostraticola tofi]